MGVGLVIFYANILFSNMRLGLKADELLSELAASRKTLYGPTFNADNCTLHFPKICILLLLNVIINSAVLSSGIIVITSHFHPSPILWGLV
jgi:hypothetical protein